MKLNLKNPLQAKSCSFVAIIMALVTMAASKAAADNHVRVFNEKVSGVPAANPVVIFPSVLSPEFTAGLVAQGLDLLENPSGSLRDSETSATVVAPSRTKTLISFSIIIRVKPSSSQRA